MTSTSRIKIVIFIVLAAVIYGIIRHFDIDLQSITPQRIKEFILSFGIWAPAAFIVLYTLRSFVLFPASVLTLTAGLAFGPLWGTIYTIIGATSSACVAFMLARYFGKDMVTKLARGKLEKFDRASEQHGFKAIFFMRLVPVFPFDVVNSSAGLSSISFRDYFIATVIGMIPGTFVYVYLGDSLVNTKNVVIAVAMLVVLIAIPLVYKHLKSRN